MALGRLGQIHISVSDMARAVAFYRDILGIPLMFEVPGQPMAFFASGDVRLYLGKPEAPQYTSKCVLYFHVDDIDAEVARIEGRGITMNDRPHIVHRDAGTDLWMSGLQDPDGHQVILMEERSSVD